MTTGWRTSRTGAFAAALVRVTVSRCGIRREGAAGRLPDAPFAAKIESPGEGWIQDPDVLDTWFPRWLWAHETMDEAARKTFYPTSVLVTRAGHYFLLGLRG